MILLDTHAWVWWVAEPRLLSARARETIDGAVSSEGVAVSAISAWEVAMLTKRGRLELTLEVEDWITSSERLPFLTIVPIDARIAVRAVTLPPPLHDDPADRIIAATSLALDARLVTKDRRLRAYPPLRTVW
ncbi:MAG: type II toxin-antitoxin system VapC family toxin [Acidobacteriota bacterium]